MLDILMFLMFLMCLLPLLDFGETPEKAFKPRYNPKEHPILEWVLRRIYGF